MCVETLHSEEGGNCMREWLIRQREKNGLTQDQVAKESEIERTYYNMIERIFLASKVT